MVYAVIPVFNGAEHTLATLKALQPLMPARGRIVVVDDGSTDGTAELVRREHPDVIVLEGDGDLWWSGAINLGARYALDEGADYVLFMNNDIILDDRFLDELIKGAEEFPGALISSKILSADEPWKVWSAGGVLNPWTGRFGMLGCGRADQKYRSEPIPADWLPGMSVLVPVEVFRKGIWVDREAFPQYSGDTDFTLRAKKAGFPLIVYPSSVVYNKVRHSGVVSKLLLGVEPFSFGLLRECLTSIKSSAAFNTFGRLILRHTPFWAWPLTLGRFYGFFFLKVLQVALKLPGPRSLVNRRFRDAYRKEREAAPEPDRVPEKSAEPVSEQN